MNVGVILLAVVVGAVYNILLIGFGGRAMHRKLSKMADRRLSEMKAFARDTHRTTLLAQLLAAILFVAYYTILEEHPLVFGVALAALIMSVGTRRFFKDMAVSAEAEIEARSVGSAARERESGRAGRDPAGERCDAGDH